MADNDYGNNINTTTTRTTTRTLQLTAIECALVYFRRKQTPNMAAPKINEYKTAMGSEQHASPLLSSS